jgi:hypothetical protein
MKFGRLCEPRLGKRGTAAALAQWQNIGAAANVKEAFDALDVKAASEDESLPTQPRNPYTTDHMSAVYIHL